MLRFSVLFLQFLLATTFLIIPVSRMFGTPTLQQVLSLGVPLWLIWIANLVELTGALLLLLGMRIDLLGAIGASFIAMSMVGATLAHVRAGNLFSELPWTLVFLGLSLVIVVLRWSVVQATLRHLQKRFNLLVQK